MGGLRDGALNLQGLTLALGREGGNRIALEDTQPVSAAEVTACRGVAEGSVSGEHGGRTQVCFSSTSSQEATVSAIDTLQGRGQGGATHTLHAQPANRQEDNRSHLDAITVMASLTGSPGR